MRSIIKLSKNIQLILLLLAIQLVSCKSDKTDSEPKTIEVNSYVSSFTSTHISSRETILVQFTNEVEEEISDKKLNDILSLSPKVDGKAYFIDKRTIAFKPSSPLLSGEEYQARVKLSKLFDVPSELSEFTFDLKVKKQVLSLSVEGVQSYNDKDLSQQQLSGVMQTYDYADSTSIEKTLSIEQKNKSLVAEWSHSKDGCTHKFTVKKIVREMEEGSVELSWSGEAIGTDTEGTRSVVIPSLSDFDLYDMTYVNYPRQHVHLTFTDPLKSKQDLSGIIHLSNRAAVRIVVDGSDVWIYPKSKLRQSTEIIIEKSVKSVNGHPLSKQIRRSIEISLEKPDVKPIANGVILPSSSGLLFPFKAVNVSGVNVSIIRIFESNIGQFLQNNNQLSGSQNINYVGRLVYSKPISLVSNGGEDLSKWNNFSIDLSELIEVEPGAIYRVHIGFDLSQSLYSDKKSDDSQPIESALESVEENRDFDRADRYFEYYGNGKYSTNLYNWSERDDPSKLSYYMYNSHAFARNVFASDLGIIAKGGADNNYTIIVSDITTTDPIEGVEVEFFNLQNQLIGSKYSDSKGFLSISLDQKPFYLKAKRGRERGYLKLDDGSSLSLSMFDTGGEKLDKGVKGFIFGERGVWRPGDSIYVSFILEDKLDVIPAEHPVIFELYNPQNQLIKKIVKRTSLNGFYDFRTATSPDDITGNWSANVSVGGRSFSKSLKIETVKPNRLKMNLEFQNKILKKGRNNGSLEVKWLHGAKGKGLKSTVDMSLRSTKTTFKRFPDYTFDDPIKSFSSEDLSIFDSSVDENGVANIELDLEVEDGAPGMLSAQFRTRAFEKGGDFSVDVSTKRCSPYSSYAGVRVPKGAGWNGALYSNEPNIIPIVTVAEDGTPIDRKVKIEVFKIGWSWWWDHDSDDDLARYVSNSSRNLVMTSHVYTINGKVQYEMKLNDSYWGRMFIRVTDLISGHTTGETFYSSYKGWWSDPSSNSPGGAEMLSLTTDKSSYFVGDSVVVTLPKSDIGRALVSLERGSRVLETFWVDMASSKGRFSFEATSEMSPNVYINVSYIQPHAQVNNDLPIRLYGVANITVEDRATHLNPIISMPDVLEPESEVTVEVEEADGKSMTYTVAIVDDGLLDLTRFKTPNAWSRFYSREALGVKSWDLYSDIIGAFSGEMSGLLALGGDNGLKRDGGAKANRFKPVVTFMGPFTLKSGSNSHTFTMPNYVGSVRTMVVAAEGGAYGSAEKQTPVKKPLMTIATLPRVLSPSESVKLPVTVFAMDSSIDEVTVEIETNKLFSIEGESEKSIEFSEEGEKDITFDLRVLDKIGVGKVKVLVSSGWKKASYEIELDVRLPNPEITEVISGSIKPGESWSNAYKQVGISGTNHGVVEISSIPPINLSKRLGYLVQYPHGCVEQTTSSIFPQLYLDNLLDLSKEKRGEIADNIDAGIERLNRFQQSDGGLSYWPGSYRSSNEWGTNYAGHFLLEAEAKGYTLPPQLKANWTVFQQRKANNWSVSSYDKESGSAKSEQLIQAYRLYTLSIAGKPAIGAMNRMREMNHLSIAAKWRLAAAYMLCGRDEISRNIVSSISTAVKEPSNSRYTYGGKIRDEAMILETLSLMKDVTRGQSAMESICKELSSDRYCSTQTTAYALLAISKYVGVTGMGGDISYSYNVDGDSKVDYSGSSVVSNRAIDMEKSKSGVVNIENSGDGLLFVKMLLSGVPEAGSEKSSSSNLTLSVSYRDMDGDLIDKSSIVQGSDFVAEVVITNPGERGLYSDMALTQVFPSGWEIRNLRMEGSSTDSKSDYEDIRDDRVYRYFDLEENESKRFKVILNAAYIGRFYLPVVSCEAMYKGDIRATIAGEWVTVVKE